MYLILVYLSLVVSNAAPGIFAEVLLPFPFNARLLEQPSWNCIKPGWACRDCNTLQKCDDQGKFEFAVTCREQYPKKPFCSPDAKDCVADKDQCQEIENGFVCPAAGLFPDLQDCRKYCVCLGEDRIGITYNCPYNSIFDIKQRKCVGSAGCYTTTADCGGKYKLIPYKQDNTFYVVCRGSEPPMLKYCGSKNLVFNSEKLECEFVCREEGMFADPLDKTKYYVCVRSGRVLVYEHKTCVKDAEFDESINSCVGVMTTPGTNTDAASTTVAIPGTT